MNKRLSDENGNLTQDATVIVKYVLECFVPLFEEYMEKGYSIFDILGVSTSALINSQKQAWLNKLTKEK